MSRNSSRASFSPKQRKACIVLVCCLLAIVVTCVLAWILPSKLHLGVKEGDYDPSLYPVDTTLGAVLTETSDAGSDYLSSTVFVGDQFTQSIQSNNQITLDQFAGGEGLSLSNVLRQGCVYFEGDGTAYTVAQALAMMKPRRVVVTLGSNDLGGSYTADTFVQDYKQFLGAINSAYPYCDIIVNSISPVAETADNAAQTQLLIDQFNQALAVMCNDAGYKFLNSAEALKENTGYGEDAYLKSDGSGFSGAGVNTLISYFKTHSYETEDRRPDTENIPKRATQASAQASPTPTATPNNHTVTYQVEEGKGTLTGNGQSGVTKIEFETGDRTTVSVTAVAADGYAFYKWSDGVTTAERYDIVTQDLSVTAMFNDARVDLTIDQGDTTINVGDSIIFNASVKLGEKDYDNSGVQWAVNDELEATAGSFTFTPTAAGSYTVKAGIEINGTYKSVSATITVNAVTATLNIVGPSSMQVGNSATLSASGENIVGDIVWSCDQQPGWTATGSQVQFTAQSVGTYTIRAKNNGGEAQFSLVVTEAAAQATPQPPVVATPTPTPVSGSTDIQL